MNDTELEESIQHTANQISDAAPEVFATINRKRWWFMSTAFPMVAGTFGPLASLLSVCALVQSWRVSIPVDATEAKGRHIPDPAWLLVLNSISLACAIVANLLLLFNFARRIRYNIAQPLTILLWYISAILLLVPLCLTRVLTIEPTTSHAFSQSYYYGIISSILYTLISTLLLFNALGAYVFKAYPPSFSTLTIPQRTIMLQTIAYALYLALGGVVFSTLEDWDFVDAIYWANYSLLTVGLGSDYPVYTNVGRGLVLPYAVGGIMMIALIVGSVRGLVLERAALRMEKVRLEKERRKWGGGHGPREEYEAMRAIEARADTARRYSALATSTTSFLVVWFLGALVFWYSEEPQGWSYFESLYFSYTSLLTIGYGDFYPKSNAGKPFFVIWSLLAVPTMTILISNLGDTVVGWLKRGTLWLGKLTILPGNITEDTLDQPTPFDTILEKEHNALRLVRCVREIASHTGSKPPRKYSWEEWKVFMELCGEDAPSNVWLKDDGPLFSDLTETKWLLERLCERLEHVLGDVL